MNAPLKYADLARKLAVLAQGWDREDAERGDEGRDQRETVREAKVREALIDYTPGVFSIVAVCASYAHLGRQVIANSQPGTFRGIEENLALCCDVAQKLVGRERFEKLVASLENDQSN